MNQFTENIKPKIKTQAGSTIDPIKLPRKIEAMRKEYWSYFISLVILLTTNIIETNIKQ